MSAVSNRKPKLKRYRVVCSVTRSELYEIYAVDREAALRDAFTDGEMVEIGDTTDVVECDVEEVLP